MVCGCEGRCHKSDRDFSANSSSDHFLERPECQIRWIKVSMLVDFARVAGQLMVSLLVCPITLCSLEMPATVNRYYLVKNSVY